MRLDLAERGQQEAVRLAIFGSGCAPVLGGTPAEVGGVSLSFHRIDELTDEFLDRARPSVILSALSGAGFDASELAARLHLLGYAGAYRVVVHEPLPCPDLVLGELQQVAPGLDLGLLRIDLWGARG